MSNVLLDFSHWQIKERKRMFKVIMVHLDQIKWLLGKEIKRNGKHTEVAQDLLEEIEKIYKVCKINAYLCTKEKEKKE